MTKGEQTRRRIVEAAAPIFNQKGFVGSSLNDLMDATGLRKGGIYRHFSSKEELAAEAFDYTWRGARDARLAHVDTKPNGVEMLRQFVANFVDVRPPVQGGCPILNTAVDADDGNPVLRARAAKALRSWLRRLEGFVEEARLSGHAGQDVKPESVAVVIVASLEGALMMSRLVGSREPLEAVREYLYRYLDREVARGALK